EQSGGLFCPAYLSDQKAFTGWWSTMTPTSSLTRSGASGSSPGTSNANPPPDGIFTRSNSIERPSISSLIASPKSSPNTGKLKSSTFTNAFSSLIVDASLLCFSNSNRGFLIDIDQLFQIFWKLVGFTQHFTYKCAQCICIHGFGDHVTIAVFFEPSEKLLFFVG